MTSGKKWEGILVYVQTERGLILQVSLQMLTLGRYLAKQRECGLYAVCVGNFEPCSVNRLSRELGLYGVEQTGMYYGSSFEVFRDDFYAAACADYIDAMRPETVLFGSTVEAKSIAAQCAAQFGTGLTADCTALTFSPDGLLLQTRPAFGGNLMADIVTPEKRPQMVTVRQGICREKPAFCRSIPNVMKTEWQGSSAFSVSGERPVPELSGLEHADLVLALGGGVRKKEDISFFRACAGKMGAVPGSSRALVERGWMRREEQIGLSGKSIAPSLLICCGISGSVQFCTGIVNAKRIIAVNSDPEAPIFAVAHTGFVGDIYELCATLLTNC